MIQQRRTSWLSPEYEVLRCRCMQMRPRNLPRVILEFAYPNARPRSPENTDFLIFPARMRMRNKALFLRAGRALLGRTGDVVFCNNKNSRCRIFLRVLAFSMRVTPLRVGELFSRADRTSPRQTKHWLAMFLYQIRLFPAAADFAWSVAAYALIIAAAALSKGAMLPSIAD